MSTLVNNGLNDLHISEKVDYLSLLEGSIKKLQNDPSFNRVASKAKAISASPKSVLVELEIGEEHVNGNGTIHGGQIAALQDIICAHAVGVSVKDTPMVALELSTSYILTAKLGETITIEGKVLKIGRNIAFAEAEFRRKSDNALIAKGKITLALLNHLKSSPKRTTRVGPVG